MSQANEHQERKKKRSFDEVTRDQKVAGQLNELFCLFALARFGWLTSHQVGQLLWPSITNSNDKARKVLARLVSTKCAKKTVLQGSRTRQIRAFFLTPKGMKIVTEHPKMRSGIRVKETKRSVTDQRYQYHRMLSNQILIDVSQGRLRLPFQVGEKPLFFSEHETNKARHGMFESLGCIPDGILKAENQLLIFEIENSRRGVQRHGSKYGLGQISNKLAVNKMTNFLPTYIDMVIREGKYQTDLGFLGSQGSFSDTREIFVCTDERIFRSIWRMVEELLQRHVEEYETNRNALKDRFIYVLMKSEQWIDPLHKDNIRILEHHEPVIRQMLADADPVARSHRIS